MCIFILQVRSGAGSESRSTFSRNASENPGGEGKNIIWGMVMIEIHNIYPCGKVGSGGQAQGKPIQLQQSPEAENQARKKKLGNATYT